MKLWLSFVPCLGFPKDAVLISCGFQATHILPVVGGAVDHAHCKRLNVGGSHLVTYMQHLVQLQVPSLRQYIYHSRAEVSRKGGRGRWEGREGGGAEGSRKGGEGEGEGEGMQEHLSTSIVLDGERDLCTYFSSPPLTRS